MDPRSLIGKQLDDVAVPTPTVVLDRAAVARNCEHMLQAAKALGIGWRAHIKTHKTTELTRLMVGTEGPARIVVSTLLEAERVLPLLREYQSQGRTVNVLYGFPLYASAVARLAAIGRALGGAGGVSVIVDHPAQVAVVRQLADAEGVEAVDVFLKIDMGTSRAGVVPGSANCAALMRSLLTEHHHHAGSSSSRSTTGRIVFHGLYCHAGHSYDARQPWASMTHLVAEFSALAAAAREVRSAAAELELAVPRLTVSVGASPTAATLQHPDLGGGGGGGVSHLGSGSGSDSAQDQAKVKAAELRATLDGLVRDGMQLEAHAGVYPVRDLQQLATHSWAGVGATDELADLAMTVLADVASIYPGRGGSSSSGSSSSSSNGCDEVLINAGCLALARETVKKTDVHAAAAVYADAFGIVAPWTTTTAGHADGRLAVPDAAFPLLPDSAAAAGWWQVARISQEHGILTWAGAPDAIVTPAIGQRLRIWPNHACITAAMFGYFLVVDSSRADPTEIVDVWERWTGW